MMKMMVRLSDDIIATAVAVSEARILQRAEAFRVLFDIGIKHLNPYEEFDFIEPGHYPTQIWFDEAQCLEIDKISTLSGQPKSTVVRAALTKGSHYATS